MVGTKSKLFNCVSLPAELRSVQNSKLTMSEALAELIDNSFGEERGDAKNVWITFDRSGRVLTVMDDGRGAEQIGLMFQRGAGVGIGSSKGFDPGQYGVGGKEAVLWLSSKVTIWSLRDKRVMTDTVMWRDWFTKPSYADCNVSDEWVPATVRNTPAELLAVKHGVMIQMQLLHHRKINPSKLERELSGSFAPGLRAGKKIHWTELHKGEVVDQHDFVDPSATHSADAQRVNFDLIIEHALDGKVEHLPVSGTVFYDETTTVDKSRIEVGFGYRVILKTTDCFQSQDGSEKYPGVGVSGYLDLGQEWRKYLGRYKNELTDEYLFDELMAHVFERIKPLLLKSQRKELYIQIEDLALGLQAALSSKIGPVEVKTGGGRGSRVHDGDGPVYEPDPDNPIPPINPPVGEEEGKRPKQRPPLLEVIPVSDAVNNGHLCRAEVSPEHLRVTINAEHAVIKQAMQAKPPANKWLFNQLVIDEMAAAIVEVPDPEAVILRLFRANLARELSEADDKRRTITRHLADRVNNPQLIEALDEVDEAAE